jgi:transaldolase
MKATAKLHEIGQSIWLDNITRDLLESGTLARYIAELSVTGLTSNPTIFDHAIKGSSDYDAAIRSKLRTGKSGEALFFELALADITRAADLFRPVFERTGGVDGWVSLEVSPLLAYDTKTTLAVAKELHARAGRPNLFIKIPGTPQGLPAIEEAIFAGVPINVTLLFSREHYLAAADAYLRGIERRIAAGLSADVGSVASLFISRWDVAVASKVPPALVNKLGIAIGQRSYKAYCDLVASPRYRRVLNEGGRPQRLLFASTGTKDPKASDVLYVEALAAPFTVNTMPEATLLDLYDHGNIGATTPPDGGDCEAVLTQFKEAGVDIDAVAATLQSEGASSFVKSWNELMSVLASKSETLKAA